MRESSLLVYRLGSLGDMVMALPALHLIRRQYADRRIVLLTNEPVIESAAGAGQLLLGSGLCDEVLGYPVGLRDPKRLWRLRMEIKARRFEVAFDMNSSAGLDRGDNALRCYRNYIFLRFCGIKRILGGPWNRGHRVIKIGASDLENESARLLKRLRIVGSLDLADRAVWSLGLNSKERIAAATLLNGCKIGAKFAVFCTGTKAAVKDWGDSNWRMFFEDFGAAVGELAMVAIGAKSDYSRADKLLAAWRGPIANLCGRCEPRVSAAVLERAALFVGHDSGPMHLAAAVGTPAVAIFSWHNPPGLWFPGHPSWKNIKVLYPTLEGNRWNLNLRLRRGPEAGILLIKPREVIEACLKLIDVQS